MKSITEKTFVQKKSSAFIFCMFTAALLLLPLPVFSENEPAGAPVAEAGISAEEDELIFQKSTSYYNKGMYLKAVDEINIAVELHQATQDVPDNIRLMAEASYYAWINSLKKNSIPISQKDYDKMILSVTLHPEVASDRVLFLVNEFYDQKKHAAENERLACIEKENRKGLDKAVKKISLLNEHKNNLDDVVSGRKTVEDIRRIISVENEYKKARTMKGVMILLYSLLILSILLLILLLRQRHKKMLFAQGQFETTMKVVSILQKEVDGDASPYKPLNTNGTESGTPKTKRRKKIGLSDFESVQIAESFFSGDDAKKRFLSLQHNCMELGERVDKVTGRKRNSKKVSELVFKLCKVSGVDDELSLIYYCAAMVYDAGFLSVPKNILQGEHLTIRERYEVRSHVQKTGEYFGFIPQELQRIFFDASEFHHENCDGNGYLSGLSGNKIPLIARFIRVAESYISLVSVRSYRKIMDSESALIELKKNSGMYDAKILALLEKVI